MSLIKSRRKKSKMKDARRIDIEAIRKRILEEPSIVFDGEKLHIAIRFVGGFDWFSLVDASYGSLPESKGSWAIHPEDECELSNDGKTWVKGQYFGISGFPFVEATTQYYYSGAGEYWHYIRPMQKDSPEKTEAMRRIARAEKELKAAKEQLKIMN